MRPGLVVTCLGGRYAPRGQPLLVPGVTTYSLGLLLPDGEDRFVALFTTPPAPDASGAVEVSAVGYARKAHDAWTTSDEVDGSFVRSNNGAIEFDAFVLPVTAGRIEAIGVYDALTLGNLLLWARCDMVEDIEGGEQVRCVTGTLRFGSTP